MTDEPPGAVGWLTVALLCGCALLSALLELLFLSRFYVGATIVPLVVGAALLGNVVVPFLGHRAVGSASGAVLPVVVWLVTVLGLSMYTRPEGDLFVIDAYHQQAAFYALLLVGAVAGFVTTIAVTGRVAAPGAGVAPPGASRGTSRGAPRGGSRVSR